MRIILAFLISDNQLDGDHDDGAATDSADSEAKLARQDQKSRTEELFQSRVGAEPKQVRSLN